MTPQESRTLDKIRTELSRLLGISPEDIDNDILTNIVSYPTKAALTDFVRNFVCFAQDDDVESFVELVLSEKPPMTTPAACDVGEPKRDASNGCYMHRSALVDCAPSLAEISVSRESEPAGDNSGLLGNCLGCGKIACSGDPSVCSFCQRFIAAPGSFHPYGVALHSPATTEAKTSPSLGNARRPRTSQKPRSDGPISNSLAQPKLEDLQATTQAIEDLEKAIAVKNEILEFQKTAAERTRIYDDSTDWFRESCNIWISEDERKEASRRAEETLKEKSQHSKSRIVTIDLVNRRVVECASDPCKAAKEIDTFLQRIQRPRALLSNDNNSSPTEPSQRHLHSNTANALPSAELSGASYGLYQELENRLIRAAGGRLPITPVVPSSSPPLKSYEHLLNAEISSVESDLEDNLQEDHADTGLCLTLHQPYASLLVYGIKRAEGRTWCTSYRGRLWIHAAQHEPTPEDILSVETFYSNLYRDDAGCCGLPRPFPTTYPTSVLLGCVTLTDCVAQSEYRASHCGAAVKGSEVYEPNSSPYIFICKAPKRLLAPIPMPGQHKLWSLPQDRIEHYQRALRKS